MSLSRVGMSELLERLSAELVKLILLREYYKKQTVEDTEGYTLFMMMMVDIAAKRQVTCSPRGDRPKASCASITITDTPYPEDGEMAKVRTVTIYAPDRTLFIVRGYDVLSIVTIFVRYPDGRTTFEHLDSRELMDKIFDYEVFFRRHVFGSSLKEILQKPLQNSYAVLGYSVYGN